MTVDEKHEALFFQLVMMFHTLTMHQLGKIKNPVTDKIERDLPAAQASIDMLEMLKQRTKGNLNDNEQRMLNELLKELKLNYVDEAGKPDLPKPEETKAPT
jgi:hypothetical protein